MKENTKKTKRLKVDPEIRENDIEYVVDGNTVREVEVLPARKKKNKPVEKTSVNVKRNRERALAMNLPYLMMLSVALIIAGVICANYIAVQTRLSSVIKDTQSKESQLKTLKSENDALENVIATYVDLDHVRDVAVNKLGMIYARKNQIITYEKTESEYVRQFEDIPQ